jgi:hypothetical protein
MGLPIANFARNLRQTRIMNRCPSNPSTQSPDLSTQSRMGDNTNCERQHERMDYAMKNNKWYKLRGGDYILTAWVGDDQLTYRIVHQQSGWVPSRKVAGAGMLMLDFPQKTLRQAQAVAEADAARGL